MGPFKQVSWGHNTRILLIPVFLYLFFVSISLLGESFVQMGEGLVRELLATTSNPFVGLLVGILATSIIQSSSTVTSITVGLVAGGGLEVAWAIPIVMGSNMGTSVTNAIVAAGHIHKPTEFKRAFAAAVVDDFFEICSIAILFPLQLHFDILGVSAAYLSRQFDEVGGLSIFDPLNALVEPVVQLLMFFAFNSGALMLLFSLALLFVSLRYMLLHLEHLFAGRVENFFETRLFHTATRAMLLGFAITALLQSSSMTTSLAVALSGAGFLSLRQVFPYVLGANVGTTLTAMLAALVTGEGTAVTVAFAHLLYNVFGIGLVWPMKSVPLRLARLLAEYSLRSRLVPLAYVCFVFFLIPITLIYVMRE